MQLESCERVSSLDSRQPKSLHIAHCASWLGCLQIQWAMAAKDGALSFYDPPIYIYIYV